MGHFMPQYNKQGTLRGFHCSQCCESVAGSRLVRRCWHQHCIRSCRFYDMGCVPKDGYHEHDDNHVAPFWIYLNGSHKRHIRTAGECVFCSGTGLSPVPGEGKCQRCNGDGVCPSCHGEYFRLFDELTKTEQESWLKAL